MRTWIIGSGGLLGSALVRTLDRDPKPSHVPWHNPDEALRALIQQLEDFSNDGSRGTWSIIWAAGRATTSTSAIDADRELALYKGFLNAVTRQPPQGQGVFTLASSAGGIYAGSADPPFSCATTPHPIGVYGQLKREQELATLALAEHTIRPVIARVSNLYGPGQDITKLQGVVSRLCLAALERQPMNVFVPLDTLRDYIYVDDAAARIMHWTTLALSTQPTSTQRAATHDASPHIKVIATGQSVSLGQVINTVQDVLHTRIPVSFGFHPTASVQTRDIRLTPDHDDVTKAMPLMPFPAGVRRVYEDMLNRRQVLGR